MHWLNAWLFLANDAKEVSPIEIGDGGGDIINLRETNVPELTCVAVDALEIRKAELAVRSEEDEEDEVCCEDDMIKSQCSGIGSR